MFCHLKIIIKGEGKNWADSGYIWRREPRRIIVGLYPRQERKRGLRDDNSGFGGLSNQVNGWFYFLSYEGKKYKTLREEKWV